ncbi:MAG: methionyl-tRNA formyltransferase [Chloroflexota bacterium]
MRLAFMGTPDFAVPSLERLAASGHHIVMVVTQPDRPAGRGQKLTPPPVKSAALALGVPLLQPARLREAGVQEALAASRPEVVVVAAFGQLLPASVLELPRFGCLNVHASLLPRWRGAAPIAAAILAGDAQTGITIMRMERGLDTGPMLTQRAVDIAIDETAGELTARLSQVGADLLLETLPRWVAGEVSAQPQDNARATYAPQLHKQDGQLDWREPATALWRRCRACQPWPGAFSYWAGQPLKILDSTPLSAGGEPAEPGTMRVLPAVEVRARALRPSAVPGRGTVLVASTGEGELALLRVQPAGGRPRGGDEFARALGAEGSTPLGTLQASAPTES